MPQLVERVPDVSPPADDMRQVVEYHNRRKAVRDRVKAMGHGTQFRITQSLGVSSSLISSILSGRYMDPPTLQKIEDWVNSNEETKA